MKFETHISKTMNNEHHIYEQRVTDLMRTHSFTEVVFLLYKGALPDENERKFLDVLLVAGSEHGVEAPSLYVPRISVASGNSVHTAMAAGILAIGEVHGGAGEASAQLLLRQETPEVLVAEYEEKNERLPGFGHRTYVDVDPRAEIIFEKAKETYLPLDAFTKAYAIEEALQKKKNKKLPLNIDGAFGAGIIALGMQPSVAKALFVLARVAGMGAHAIEEREQKNGYYRL